MQEEYIILNNIEKIEKWNSQFRRGFLELCILLLISKESTYGYSIQKTLENYSLKVTEGALYPLLTRLIKEGVLSAEWSIEDGSSHPRKYYEITQEGRDILNIMIEEFKGNYSIFNNLNNLGDTNENK